MTWLELLLVIVCLPFWAMFIYLAGAHLFLVLCVIAKGPGIIGEREEKKIEELFT